MNDKYTFKELRKLVKKYAKEDGCTHYILKESDGTISQTCDAWVDWDIEKYAKENNIEVLETIEPY